MKVKKTIGRKDKVDFPELELNNIDIKIDTGAYTSAIHCHKIKVVEINDTKILKFTLLDPTHPQYEGKELSTENFKEKRIKSSFGRSENRFIIKTNIRLFGKKYIITLSLSERGEMRFPVLIGRKFLMGKYVVDTSLYDVSYKLKLETKNTQR